MIAMPTFRNKVTGVEMTVGDEKVLGPEWEPIETSVASTPAKRPAAKKTAKKTSEPKPEADPTE